MNAQLRTLALVALVALGAFVGAGAAASNGSLTASPATPGDSSTHTATLTVGNASTGSLNGFQVDYAEAGIDVSTVGAEHVVAVGIDENDDASGATVDQNVSDDLSSVSQSNNGQTLTFTFGGSYELSAGDEVVVVYEGVENPAAGDYQISLDINPQSSGGEGAATLTVEDDTSSTQTAADTATATEEPSGDQTAEPTATEEPAAEETATATADADGSNEMDATEETTTSGPGFGAGLTVLALLGAAFVAMRRGN